MFDRLQPELRDARVADIFAGTGVIGLEALSRGASRVVFIEKDPRAAALLRENIRSLGVESETLCWATDVDRCSFRPKGREGFLPFDVVFLDPPYPVTRKLLPGHMLHRALGRLARDEITVPGALLVLRCAKGTHFDMPVVWQRDKLLDYSCMEVHLFRRAALGDSTKEQPLSHELTDHDGSPSDAAAI